MGEASDIDRFTGQALELLGQAENVDGAERRQVLARAQVFATLAAASALQRIADAALRAGEPAARPLFAAAEKLLAGNAPLTAEVERLALQEAPLDQFLPPLDHTPAGFTTVGWDGRGGLRVPVGGLVPPLGQDMAPLWLDLAGPQGHAAVVGAPQSGKSTLLRTLVAALALTHTPDEAQFYCLDFGRGSLAALGDLPHTAGVADHLDSYRVSRTVEEVAALLDARERYFAEHEIDSIAAYRRLRAADEILGDGFGDVFLVVDDWLVLRQEYEKAERAVYRLAQHGLGYGIHILASANSWLHLRTDIRGLFGTKLELRLGDPYDSAIDRGPAAAIPPGRPGRGIAAGGTHFQTALPRIDGRTSTDDLADGVRDLVEAVSSGWRGAPATKVRVLPRNLPLRALPTAADTGARVPIGVAEPALSPVLLDFAADPHVAVVGDRQCGKSNLLRLIAKSIMDRHAPSEIRLVVVDYHRSLLDLAGPHTDHAASPAEAADLLGDVHGALAARLPASGGSRGPEVFLLVDDYELVAATGNPLAPIAELLPWSRDIGLRLILARAMSGAGRAVFDPIIQHLKADAGPALMMSGPREEGVLFGDRRPEPLPPGRARYVHRTGHHLIQTARVDTAGDA